MGVYDACIYAHAYTYVHVGRRDCTRRCTQETTRTGARDVTINAREIYSEERERERERERDLTINARETQHIEVREIYSEIDAHVRPSAPQGSKTIYIYIYIYTYTHTYI